MNYVSAITDASGELAAGGKAVHTGRRSVVADGKVTDAKGRLCAVGSTICLVFDPPVL